MDPLHGWHRKSNRDSFILFWSWLSFPPGSRVRLEFYLESCHRGVGCLWISGGKETGIRLHVFLLQFHLSSDPLVLFCKMDIFIFLGIQEIIKCARRILGISWRMYN